METCYIAQLPFRKCIDIILVVNFCWQKTNVSILSLHIRLFSSVVLHITLFVNVSRSLILPLIKNEMLIKDYFALFKNPTYLDSPPGILARLCDSCIGRRLTDGTANNQQCTRCRTLQQPPCPTSKFPTKLKHFNI